MWRRSACPTSAGTGTTGTPAIRQPAMASAVGAVGRGQHGDPVGTADPFGHRGGGPDDVAAAERHVAEADGVLDIAATAQRRDSASSAARQQVTRR